MNTLDIILILCFIPFLIRGIGKGFIAQVFSILAIVLGAWISFRFSTEVCEWLKPYLDVSQQILNVITFALIMVAAIIGMHLLGKLLHGLFKLVMLGWLDSLLGLVFSLLCGALAVGLFIILFDTLNTNLHLVKEELLNESVLYGPLKDIAYTIYPYFKDLLFKQ